MNIRIASYSLQDTRAIPDIRSLTYYPGLQRTGNYERSRRGFGPPIGAVQHIAVTPEDRVGVDSSAENVTAYGLNLGNRRASWNDCIDRDSYCPLLPPTVRPWQQGVAGMGVDMNCAGIGQEMGIYDTNWDAKPDWFVEAQLRMSAAVWAAWFTAYGWPIKTTLNRTRLFELARRGESWGLTSHAVIDPSNRSDPGVHRGRDTFPWNRLLSMIHEEQTIRTAGGGATPVKPEWETKEFISAVQQLLNDLTDAGLAVDGIRGPKTEAAAKHYQANVAPDFGHTLDVDGSPGPLTRSALEADMTAIKELTALVERIDRRLHDHMKRTETVPLTGTTADTLGTDRGTTLPAAQVLDNTLRNAARTHRQTVGLEAAITAAIDELGKHIVGLDTGRIHEAMSDAAARAKVTDDVAKPSNHGASSAAVEEQS